MPGKLVQHRLRKCCRYYDSDVPTMRLPSPSGLRRSGVTGARRGAAGADEVSEAGETSAGKIAVALTPASCLARRCGLVPAVQAPVLTARRAVGGTTPARAGRDIAR